MRTILIAALVLVLAAPTALAQDLTGPLEDHAQNKTDAARSDPVAFATGHANEQAIAHEAEWGVAYTCYAVDYAEEHHGTPDPELEQCEDYEEALGIEPEPTPEEPVAIAENLTEGPIEKVKALADDAVGTVHDIVDEPTSVVEELVAFIGRALAAAGRIVGGAALLALYALGLGLGVATDLAEAALEAASLTGVSLGAATEAASSASRNSLDAAGTAMAAVSAAAEIAQGVSHIVGAIGSGVAAATGAVVEAAASVARSVGDAGDSIGQAIRGAWEAIFGGEASGTEAPQDLPLDDVPVEADGLGLPDVDRIIEDLR